MQRTRCWGWEGWDGYKGEAWYFARDQCSTLASGLTGPQGLRPGSLDIFRRWPPRRGPAAQGANTCVRHGCPADPCIDPVQGAYGSVQPRQGPWVRVVLPRLHCPAYVASIPVRVHLIRRPQHLCLQVNHGPSSRVPDGPVRVPVPPPGVLADVGKSVAPSTVVKKAWCQTRPGRCCTGTWPGFSSGSASLRRLVTRARGASSCPAGRRLGAGSCPAGRRCG